MSLRNSLFSSVRARPYRAMLYAVNGAVLIEPRIFTVPVFWALGFERRGPRKDSTASTWMRTKDESYTQNVYSTVQSAAMGGSGMDGVNVAVRVGAVLLSVAAWRRGRR